MNPRNIPECPAATILALHDCLTVLNGKWKVPIIGALFFGPKRFNELETTIKKITPRMLSKELKELELNNIVQRNVYNTRPIRIEYELTESGKTLEPILEAMVEWGTQHRKETMSKTEN
ncbi:winged helix-turn-helix transcriptional regulator [Aureispira anguillae]|uniref:Helix-turn-helix transcriptional regulator n=1 Tax=Aureispira anguillae TaxID=2864201 RepID=A0A915YJ26_9BACT|nr:helix-turn-helix domain-containing protein [Aureispira anguillae]BDS13758.1 helix-turn-helix transcriptional regulator [Aureispira anguillae]